MSTKWAVILEYDGTDYHGYQIQNKEKTVQKEFEEAIFNVLGEFIHTQSSSRTDVGTHSLGQVVSFQTNGILTGNVLKRAINHNLSKNIKIAKIKEVSLEFDPRRDAISRIYKYTFYNRDVNSPIHDRFSCWIPDKINLTEMKKAVHILKGKHEFKYFTPNPSNYSNTVRNVFDTKLTVSKSFITFQIEADSFLYHQIRKIVGVLLDIGKKKISINQLKKSLLDDNQIEKCSLLPSKGLCLMKINYPENIFI